MGQPHPSTPAQRAQWSSQMIAHAGEYGFVMQLSRTSGLSRPTLYAWRKQAEQALQAAFSPPKPLPRLTPLLSRQVLTLWSAHSSDRDIQTCYRALTQQGISLTTITAILAEAEQRALAWLATHAPPTIRALALSEISANDRQGAYLNVADVHSGAVWTSVGPLAADRESWILVLWELQARELAWDRVTMDGGAAGRTASQTVTPDIPIQGDHWHVLHSCAQLQGRLKRQVRMLQQQSVVVARQAARVAAGQKPKGRHPKTDLTAHAEEVARAQSVVEDVQFLTHQLPRLLSVVVLDRRGVLSAAQRQTELESLLTLLAEVAALAPVGQQALVQRLHTLLTDTLPELLTFVARLDRVQADLRPVLGPEKQALLAWAWLRRKPLGWRVRDILAALPADWRDAARVLLTAWADAVLLSTAVERWHSMVRTHLAVHRTLSPGKLALLAVFHNHRVFSRGIHKGKNPLQLSGMLDAPTDWLVALGYPPASQVALPHPAPATVEAVALAA